MEAESIRSFAPSKVESCAASMRNRRRRTIDNEHDRSLKTFGAVNGHGPDFVSNDVGFALHFQVRELNPSDETLKARCVRPLKIKRERQKRVDDVIDLAPEGLPERLPASVDNQNPLEERIRTAGF